MLSKEDLRNKYDKFGKKEAVPQGGFEDAAEEFSIIFGNQAFESYIGELQLLKNLQKSEELSAEDERERKREREKKKKKKRKKRLLRLEQVALVVTIMIEINSQRTGHHRHQIPILMAIANKLSPLRGKKKRRQN